MRLALKVVMQNDRDFVDVIYLCTSCKTGCMENNQNHVTGLQK
jgi:hypothetical protein